MKKLFLTSMAAALLSAGFAQKTEWRLALNSGLFRFAGASAEAVSFINYDARLENSAYTNNPYGSLGGLCYGVSANLKRVTKAGFLWGFDLGFERLRSKTTVSQVNGYDGNSTYQYPTTGRTFLNFNFINGQPFIGYRLARRLLKIDLTGGFDLGYCLNARENGRATAANGIAVATSVDRTTIRTDFRPRLQLSADYKRYGAYMGYSFGQRDYKEGHSGGINECYSRLLRFGFTHLLN